MADVFQMLQDQIIEDSQNADLFLATVTNVNSSGLTLILDGETEATAKRYKYMTSGYADPVAGDRVVVMKMSGTFVVLGRIGSSPKTTEGKVNRSGDTMTGDLVMDGKDIDLDSTIYTVGVRPSGNFNDRHVFFRDKLKNVFGRIQSVFFQDGRVGLQMVAERTVSGDLIQNILGLNVREDGTCIVGLNQVPWLTALGLGTNGSLPITIAQGGTGNTGVYTTSTVSEIATAGSGFSITDAFYAQWGKLAMVEITAKTTQEVTLTTTTPVAALVTGKRPASDAIARVWLSTSRSAVITQAGNLLTNAGTISANSEFTFISTYLLA